MAWVRFQDSMTVVKLVKCEAAGERLFINGSLAGTFSSAEAAGEELECLVRWLERDAPGVYQVGSH